MSRRPSTWSRTFRPRLNQLEARDVPATIVVNTLNDPEVLSFTPVPTFIQDGGVVSLREALESINNQQNLGDVVATGAYGANDTVTFDPALFAAANQTMFFNPANTQLAYFIGKSVDIQGPGGARLTVSGNDSSAIPLQRRVFDINGATNVRMSGLIVADGAVQGNGAGVRNATAALSLDAMVFRNNVANFVPSSPNNIPAFGGAVFSDDALTSLTTIGFSTFEGNQAKNGGGTTSGRGGAVSAGRLAVSAVAFRANSADQGGAVWSNRATNIDDTTFDGNLGTDGGALYLTRIAGDSPISSVSDSTFANNQASNTAAAAYIDLPGGVSGNFTLSHGTVARNAAFGLGSTGGLLNPTGQANAVIIVNSVVALNTADGAENNLSGLFTGSGGNVFGSVVGATFAGGTPGGPTGVDPLLDTQLRDNDTSFVGQTLHPLAGSPVLGAGQPGGLSVDERNKPRPSQGFYDSGAVQAQRPTGNTDGYTTPAGQTLLVPAATGVLVNDVQNEVFATGLTSTLLTIPPNNQGTVEFLLANGSFKFVPATGFSGPTSFTYTLSDGITSVPVTVNITVSGASFPPTANPDTYSTPAGVTLTVPAATGVLANDTLGSGAGPLTATNFTAVNPAAAGTLTPAADGSFVFVPATDFAGLATFTYTAFDGQFSSSPATVTLKVVPVAANDAYSTLTGQTLTVSAAQGLLLNDTPSSGLTATNFSQLSNPAAGLLTTAADGSLQFEPAAGFVGQVTFTYSATVGAGFDGPPATVTLTVIRPTVAAPDFYTTVSGLPLTVDALGGLLGNDTAGSGPGPFIATDFSVVSPAAAGTVVGQSDGSFVFSPTPGYVGTATFTYAAFDGQTSSGNTLVTIVVNAPPVANPDAYSTPAGQQLTVPDAGVLGNDTGTPPPGGTLRAVNFSGLSPATAGTLTTAPGGGFTFTPNAGFAGTATFTYQVDDGTTLSPPGTVTLTVPLPAAPQITFGVSQPAVSLTPGSSATLPFTVSGFDPLTLGVTTQDAAIATGTLGGAGANRTVTVSVPATAVIGSVVRVTVSVSDIFGRTQGRFVNVTVVAPPLATVTAADDAYTLPSVGTFAPAAGVLANDTPTTGTTAALVQVVPAGTGTLVFNPDGSFTFTPAAGISGLVTFRYTASAGGETSAPATVRLTVVAPQPLAVPPNRAYSGAPGTTVRVPVAELRAGVTSPNGGPVRVSAVAPTRVGGPAAVFDAATDSYTFEIPPDAVAGALGYAYTLTDTASPPQSATGILTLTVTRTGTLPGITRYVAYGSGAGTRAVVRVVRPGGAADLVFRPFEDSFLGGARVALADINLDGVDDIIVGAGAGGGPRITVYDGSLSTTAAPVLIADFFAFEKSFRGGVHVAAADAVRAVGTALRRTSLLVAGAGSTPDQPADPRVVAFAPGSLPPVGDLTEALNPTLSYYAYKQGFRGGVRVAAGDLRGTGVIDVVTIPGPSGGPDLKVWDTTSVGADGVPSRVQSLAGLGADLGGYRGGAFVAVSRGLLLVTPDGPAAFDGTVLAALAPGLLDSDGNSPSPEAAADNTRTRPRLVAFTATGLSSGTAFVGATPQVFDLGGAGFTGSVRVAAGQEPGGDGTVALFGAGPDEAGLVRRVTLSPPTGSGAYTVSATAVAAGATSNPLAGLVTDAGVSVYVGLAPLQYTPAGE